MWRQDFGFPPKPQEKAHAPDRVSVAGGDALGLTDREYELGKSRNCNLFGYFDWKN
jgi:hypothetical protein